MSKAGLFVGILMLCLSAAGETRLYVAPNGNDAWTGALAAPNAAATDGPLATLARARDLARELRKNNALTGGLRIQLRGGNYFLAEPVVFTPEDSGSPGAPVYLEAYPGETPILHGGRPVRDWKQDGTKWIATLGPMEDGRTPPGALWVNGQRRTIARTPNAAHPNGDFPETADTFYAAPVVEKDAAGKDVKSATSFLYRPDELQAWSGLKDAVFVIYHSWETSLLRMKSLDEAAHRVEFTRAAPWCFGYWTDRQRYYVENLMEALDQPGEWCYERKTGTVHYIPMPGEDMATAEAFLPVAQQLLVLKGDAAAGQYVQYLHFLGLRFLYTEYPIGPEGHADSQAASSVNATVELTGARHCVFERCEIGHTGGYGLWFHAGSQDNLLQRSELFDLGAGAVRIGEGKSPATEPEAALRNTVDNCFLHDGGRIFRGAVGVWIGRSSYNTLSHNEICDFRYTGISVGWSWGYDPSSANHNRIEDNHVHHIGLGQLNDMGGIYTLGDSPGTVIRGNIFHDVLAHKDSYGGWGIYYDEGSTGILSENNLVYNTLTGSFHQHYGRENSVINNILAYSRRDQLQRSREEGHLSFTFERNIVYFNNESLLGSTWKNGNFRLDGNCYWTTSKNPIDFAGRSFEEWQAEGRDVNSVIADPLFVAAESGDFRLMPGSPALGVGFVPFDLTHAGLYGEPEWKARPTQIQRPAFSPPPPPEPFRLSEDFETYSVGASIKKAHVSEEDPGIVRVSDETAASGKLSLKFTDAPGLKYRFNPHICYTPPVKHGVLKGRFALLLRPGTVFFHEWREQKKDDAYLVGPTLRTDAEGRLMVNGQSLGKIPFDEWVTIQIRCGLGALGDGTATVSVETQKTGVHEYTVRYAENPLRRLDWWGFVADGDGPGVCYIDDLELAEQ